MTILHQHMAQKAQLGLLARPGLDQRAIDREMLIRQEVLGLGLGQDLLEERRGHGGPPNKQSRFVVKTLTSHTVGFRSK